MNTQLPANKVYIGLTEEGEYNLKQARCEERRQNGLKWIAKWQMVTSGLGPQEPPNHPWIYNKRRPDGTYPSFSGFFDR